MTIEYEIEQGSELIEVTFIGFPQWDNDSFDYSGTHCTGGNSGTCTLPSYVTMLYSECATWGKELHTPEQNEIIANWLQKNSDDIDNKLCEAFKKESLDY